MTTPKSPTYQPEPFEEKNTRFKSSSNRDTVLLSFYSTWDSAHGVFPARISTQQRRKILPRERRHPPCLSSVSQCGSTADDTAVSLDQRPHEHCGCTGLVPASRSLSADWLTRPSITPLPGNQDHLLLRLFVAPSYF